MRAMAKRVKPFLRWAGGKQWISHRLSESIPPYTGKYFEPFLGGGSLYFATLPQRAVLSDLNQRLIETYQQLRDIPLEVIDVLNKWANDERTYYEVRQTDFDDATARAAQFIYLNRTCWNGLYRVNRQGKFNVPFGRHGRTVFNAQHLMDVSATLKNAEVYCADFEQMLKHAQQGDFVYLDPPYTSLQGGNGFRRYNESLFSWHDQQRLGRTAIRLSELGCTVLVSNADHESVVELYPGFSYERVARHSILAASSAYRRMTSELLLASDPTILQVMSDEVK